MRSKQSITALCAFFVALALAVAVAGCGSSSSGSAIPAGSVAVVAGNKISLKALDHWMYVAEKSQAQGSTQPVIVPNDPPQFNKCIAQARAEIPNLKKTATKTLRNDCKQLFTSLSGQVMDFLIKAYWYQLEAHKLKVTPTDKQILAVLNKDKKAQFSAAGQFNTFLKQSGQTYQDVLYRVRIQQVFAKLAAKHPTTVTSAMIQAYYKSHISQFSSAEQRNMRIVLTKTAAAADAAKAALKAGQSWATVAKKYSIDSTTKDKGGLLTGVTAGQQDQALSQAAFSAPLNKLMGPIKSQYGYYLVQVIKITPAKTKTLAQETALIKQTLTQQLQTQAQTAVDDLVKKVWMSKTHCRATYAMADCAGYKAPKPSTTATTGAGAATTGAATTGTATTGTATTGTATGAASTGSATSSAATSSAATTSTAGH
jgi:foldase protein PrsA